MTQILLGQPIPDKKTLIGAILIGPMVLFFGTLVINILRAPGLIYADQQKDIKSLEGERATLCAELAARENAITELKDKLAEDDYEVVQRSLDGQSDAVLDIFWDLLKADKRWGDFVVNNPSDARRIALDLGQNSGLIQQYAGPRRIMCRIHPHFEGVLRRYFRERQYPTGKA